MKLSTFLSLLMLSLSFVSSPIQAGKYSPIIKVFVHAFDDFVSSIQHATPPPPHQNLFLPDHPPPYKNKFSTDYPNKSPDPSNLMQFQKSNGNIWGKQLDQSSESNWAELSNEKITRKKIRDRDRSPYDFRGSFFNAVKDPHLIVAMPTNASQYKTIYRKESVSYDAEKELERFSKNVQSTYNAIDVGGGVTGLLKTIDSTEDQFVVVFAHSEEHGKRLVLPNGETITDHQVHEYCANQVKVCVVLTCHGDDIGILGKVTAHEALSMWNFALKRRDIANSVSTHPETIKDFIYSMRATRNRMKRNQRTQVFLSASGVVGLTSYYYSSEEKRSSN